MSGTDPSRILLVDDDIDLTKMLGQYLEAEGMMVDAVHDGEVALAMITEGTRFDAVILDVMLPAMSGIDVLCRIRESSDVPVIMLTAKGSRVARARGIELGADDYIAKPYFPRELVARIRAVIRRHGARTPNAPAARGGGLRLDHATRRVVLGSGEVDLTSTEFEILAMLVEASGAAVTKEDLSRRVLGRVWRPWDRSLDVHISKVRQKIADAKGVAIATVRGLGYRLVDEL